MLRAICETTIQDVNRHDMVVLSVPFRANDDFPQLQGVFKSPFLINRPFQIARLPFVRRHPIDSHIKSPTASIYFAN